jgi:hypothetical protein
MKRFSLAIVAALGVAMMAVPAEAGQKGGGGWGGGGGGGGVKFNNKNWNNNSNKNWNSNRNTNKNWNSSRSSSSVVIKNGFDVGGALNGAANLVGMFRQDGGGPNIRVSGGNTYVHIVFGGAPAPYAYGPMKGDEGVVTTTPPCKKTDSFGGCN